MSRWAKVLLTIWTLIGFAFLYEQGERAFQKRVAVYGPVGNISVEVLSDGGTVIFSATAEKRADCRVIPGSPVTIVALIDHGGWTEPRSYPAIKHYGEISGAPLVVSGETFIVGPWLVRDDPETIAAIRSFDVVLRCRFDSGVKRNARIGPIPVN